MNFSVNGSKFMDFPDAFNMLLSIKTRIQDILGKFVASTVVTDSILLFQVLIAYPPLW